MIHEAFFNSDYFIKMTTRASKHLLAQFTLALEIEFERSLHFYDEGYETGDDCGLSKPITSTHIYLVSSAAETSFNPTDIQKSTTPTSPLTPKWRPVEFPLHWAVCRWLPFSYMPLLAADYHSYTEEEDFPTAALNDLVWSEEPTPDRQLCIHMAQDNSATGLPTPLHGAHLWVNISWMDTYGWHRWKYTKPHWHPWRSPFSRLCITTLGLNCAQTSNWRTLI